MSLETCREWNQDVLDGCNVHFQPADGPQLDTVITGFWLQMQDCQYLHSQFCAASPAVPETKTMKISISHDCYPDKRFDEVHISLTKNSLSDFEVGLAITGEETISATYLAHLGVHTSWVRQTDLSSSLMMPLTSVNMRTAISHLLWWHVDTPPTCNMVIPRIPACITFAECQEILQVMGLQGKELQAVPTSDPVLDPSIQGGSCTLSLSHT